MAPLEQSPDLAIADPSDVYVAPPRTDRYEHFNVTESENIDAVHEAWRIHAQGYLDMGFVTKDAITEEGFLAPEVDKSRGDNTVYHLALNPDLEKTHDCATMRIDYLGKNQTYQDLPAYGLSRDKLWAGVEEDLADLHAQGKQFVEIAGLAKAPGAHPIAIFEMVRDALHDSLGKDRVWMYTLVSSTYDSLVRSWGEANLQLIGDDVAIDDKRVNEGLTLKPGLIHPDQFVGNLLTSYTSAVEAGNRMDARILQRSFLFFSDGLSRERLGEDVFAARQQMLGDQ